MLLLEVYYIKIVLSKTKIYMSDMPGVSPIAIVCYEFSLHSSLPLGFLILATIIYLPTHQPSFIVAYHPRLSKPNLTSLVKTILAIFQAHRLVYNTFTNDT